MALVESQEVKLAISTETIGAGDVEALASQIGALADKGGQAAPEFAKLAEELDRIKSQQVQVDGLDAAIQSAKSAYTAFSEARHEVQVLDKALADAKGAGANQAAIKVLEQELRKANASLTTSERAWRRQKEALDQARSSVQASGIDTRNLAAEKLRLASAVDSVDQRFRNLSAAAAPAVSGLGQMSRGAQETKTELEALGKSGDDLKNKFTALEQTVLGVFAAAKLKGYATDMIGVADAYGQMATRIEMATESQEEYERVQARLLENANITYRPLAETQEMYIRTADALRSLGYNTDQVLDVTNSFTYLLTANAANAERAGNAINAYTKSLQSGEIGARSWQSIMMATPTIVDKIAAATGRSAAEIRKLGATGKLAIEDLNEGLRQTVALNKAAAESMPTTVADALTKLANTWSVYIGEANRAGGATEKLVGLINAVSENLDQLVTLATRVGETMVAVFAFKALRAVQGFAAAQLAAAGAAGTLATAQTAQAATAAVAARSTGALATATGLLAGAGRAAVTPLVALTTTIATSTAAVWAKVRALGALRVAMISTGVGALLVGLGALIAKFTEGKKEAEELGEAIDEALNDDDSLGKPLDRVSAALKHVAKEAAEANPGLAQLQEKFRETGKDAEAVSKVLKKIFSDADLSGTDGIAKLVEDMDRIKKSAYATGEQIDQSLRQRLAELTSKELREFGIQAEMAFNQGRIGAEALARINDQVLSASFDRAGVNAAQALGSISLAAQDAIEGVETLDAALRRSQIGAEQAGHAIATAIDKAISKSDSTAALDVLTGKVKEMGKEGRISGEQVTKALDKIRTKADELAPGINSAAEALKRLGVTSDADLKKTAAGLREAYEAVVKMGGSAREQGEAFRRYAEAAIAANNGVVDSTLAVEAAMHGLTVSVDGTGKAIVREMKEAEKSARALAIGVTEAGDKTEQAGKQMGGGGTVAQWMASAMDSATESIRGVSEQAAASVDALKKSSGSFRELSNGIRGLAANANELIRANPLGKMEEDLAKLEASAEAAASSAKKFERAAMYSSMRDFYDNMGAMYELESALYKARAEMAKFAIEVQQYNDTFAEGNDNLREQERLLTGLVSRAEQLGSEQLDGLRSALEDVRSQLKDMTESARDALESVRDDLDQLNENYAASERRAQEKKLAELREKLREAELAGNNEAVTLYRQAIQEQERLASLRIEEAKAREKTAKEEKSAREKEAAAAKQPAKAATAEPARPQPAQTTVHRVEINLAGRAYAVDTDAAGQRTLDALMTELERAAGVAQ